MSVRHSFRAAVSAVFLAGLAVPLGWLDWRLATMPVSLPPSLKTTAETSVLLESVSTPAARFPLSTDRLDFSSFLVIAERPLFVPGRRLGEAARGIEVPSPSPTVPEWNLSGIMLKGTASRALLKTEADPLATWVGPDDEISGWRVVRIDAASVLLKSAGQELRVELHPPMTSEPLAAE